MSRKRLKRTTALALEDLEPGLWGTLAPRLLHLVFLRLPVTQISQLRLLSKLWKASIDSIESDFNLLLEDKVNLNLFGFIGTKSQSQWYVLCVWMFDVNQDRWYVREINRPRAGRFAVSAADGGLVCFVSDYREDPLTMVVMNPLTGKEVELPRLLCISDVLCTIRFPLLQLKMNWKNNEYKVFFLGHIQSRRGLLAQVYDSRTKEWSIVQLLEDFESWFSGYSYTRAWEIEGSYYDGNGLRPCLYDFGEGQLRCYNVHMAPLLRGRFTMNYALLLDRLFVLHREERGGPSNLIEKGSKVKYIISEYHTQQNGAAWVKGGTHDCEPLDDCPYNDHQLSLLCPCNGHLMLMADCCTTNYVTKTYGRRQHMWLYNLSTYQWHVLPNIPGPEYVPREEDSMCELRWSATP